MLYIMRHGTTEWNAERRLQGQIDIPLNEEGVRAAREARERFGDLSFDICFASPLKRALETARIFLEGKDTPIITDDRLKEMGFGEYEGTTGYFDDPANPLSDLFQKPETYKARGGAESLEELFARTGAFMKEKVYPEIEKGRDILIVGHGAMNCSILSQINNTPIERFWDHILKNCEVVKIL